MEFTVETNSVFYVPFHDIQSLTFCSLSKMNAGRFSRHHYQRRGVQLSTDICLRCFQFGHRRHQCRNDPLVTCGKCYRTYMFTKDCLCQQPGKADLTLRMVSGQKYQKPVIDVTIGIKTYAACMNMSIENSRISLEVFQHINECKRLMNETEFVLPGVVQFPIRRRQRQATLDLEVNEEQTDAVILGMDFFVETGFTLTIDRVCVNERSPVLSCPKTIDFLYNQPQGKNLRSWLEKNDRPLYSEYKKGDSPELVEEQRVYLNNNLEEQHEDQISDILELHADDDDLNIE